MERRSKIATLMSGYIASLICIMAAFLPIYILARIVWVGKISRYRSPARELVLGLFVVFMFGLLFLTFEDNGISWMKSETPEKAWERLRTGVGVNFVPFKTIRSYLKYSSGSENTFVNIAGNILMFVPWGFGLPLLWRKCRYLWKVMSASVMLPVFIEFCQLFIGRSVDIDDVILNFAGGVLGGLLYLILSRLFPKIDKVAK